jgi:uncharacterized membrane protein (DUF485 family)
MKWMNENTIEELKKKRKFLHIMIFLQLLISFSLLFSFSFYWFCTDDTLWPYPLSIITILYFITMATYIIKRDNLSVLIYLKETTEEKP